MDEKSLFTKFWTGESKTTRDVLARIPEGSDYGQRALTAADGCRVRSWGRSDTLPPMSSATGARHTYPHTIDNGAGERITFLGRVLGPNGERVEGESVTGPGAGPPMHVHLRQVESFTVVSGRMGYQRRGGGELFAGPGETVTFPAGVAHRFWNQGPDDLQCTGYIEPPDNVEYFLGEMFASARRRGATAPDPFDAAWLWWRYRDEFAMVEIPVPVRRVVFPVLVAIGTLLGKYRKYADAPPSIGR